MKKIHLLVAAVICSGSLIALNAPVSAQGNAESLFDDDGGKLSCYGTFDNGTTNFVRCDGCFTTTGTNLRDNAECRK